MELNSQLSILHVYHSFFPFSLYSHSSYSQLLFVLSAYLVFVLPPLYPMVSFMIEILCSNFSLLCNKFYLHILSMASWSSQLLGFCVDHMTCLGPWEVSGCDTIRGLKCSCAIEFAFFVLQWATWKDYVPSRCCNFRLGLRRNTCEIDLSLQYAWSHVPPTQSLKQSHPAEPSLDQPCCNQPADLRLWE